MSADQVRAAVLKGIAEAIDAAEVKEDTVLEQSGAWDSMAAVIVVSVLDQECDVRVTGEQVFACKTPLDVLRLAGLEP